MEGEGGHPTMIELRKRGDWLFRNPSEKIEMQMFNTHSSQKIRALRLIPVPIALFSEETKLSC